MKIAVQCETGLGKVCCEDHALYYDYTNSQSILFNRVRKELEINTPFLIGVADGVGGNPGAHEASRFALCGLTDFSRRISEISAMKELESILKELNGRLIDYSSGIRFKETMATTFSAIYANSEKAYYVHTGNTRISVMHSRYLKQLTTDFTTYQFLLDHGQPEAAERCNKCEIISCMGGGGPENLTRIQANAIYDAGKCPKLAVLTSDGIHEFVDLDWMEELLADDSVPDLIKTDKLIEKSLENGSADDKTVVIIRFRNV
jgi:protein phosphatase